jgi:serine protease inhibitor
MSLPRRINTRRLTSGLVAALSTVVMACSGATAPPGPGPALTELPRPLSSAEQKVVAGSNAFSFALWQKVNAMQKDSNVFLSPLSASFALGMTMNGAGGSNWGEMRTALQFGGATQEEINAGYKSLVSLLTTLDPGVSMQVANSIWYRNSWTFLPAFLDTTKAYFATDGGPLDFGNATAALSTINGWVDSKTNHRIPTIIDRIQPQDVMYLINAIWFKGGWREKFDPAKTRAETFNGINGSTQPMQLMNMKRDTTLFVQTQSYKAVDLPYGNGAFSMTVVLPAENTSIETFANSLTPALWNEIVSGLRKASFDLGLPKLTLKWERTLNDDLKALGMVEAFRTTGADFTRMAAAPAGNNLFVSFVKQKTFVAIDEEGTEAAAATAVGIGVTSLPPQMRVDRPYIFVLRERLSGTILFMGKIVRMPTG